MIDLKEYNKITAFIKEESDKAYNAYTAIKDKEADLLSKLVNLKGKFLKIKREKHGDYLYLDVRKQFKQEKCLVLVGLGFTSVFSIYTEETHAFWKEDFSHYIRLDENFKKDMDNIEEISKEEFTQAFENMLISMKITHYSCI